MTIRFVHIGDFHAAPGPRNADRYRALDQIINENQARPELGAWLWTGDLNDSRMTIEDRNALAERLIRMAFAAPVVLVYGNHDAPGDLEIFARLSTKYPIAVLSRPTVLNLRVGRQNLPAAIFVLPYPHKAGLVGAGVAVGDVPDTGGDLLEPIFITAAEELELARERGELTLMVGHVNVAGSIMSAGQPNVGREIELHPKHLDRLGTIYKGLGHIHKPQEIAGAWYAGSVCRLDYGEIEAKRYLVVEYSLGADDVWRWVVGSRPLEVAPMHHVTGWLTRDGFLYDADELDLHAPAYWMGRDVRVRYQYRSSERAVLDEAPIRDHFKHALRLKVEGIAVPDRELRSPEVAAARTLPDKLAAYRHESQLPTAVDQKLAQLQALEPAQLLEQVGTRLAALEQLEAPAAKKATAA